MKKRFFLFLIALLFTAPVAFAGEPISLRIFADRVYTSTLYTLRVEPSKSGAREVYWHWSATAGELLVNGESEVHWRAPARAGKVTFDVAAIDGVGKTSPEAARLEVSVESPSTEAMVYVPAGTFTMGDIWTDTSEPGYQATGQNFVDKPAHSVYLDGYWIDRRKVTNRQFLDFVEQFRKLGLARVIDDSIVGVYEGVEVPFYYFRMVKFDALKATLVGAIRWDGAKLVIEKGTEEHPVMDVTWAGAVTYAFFYGKRLPTEAEWEKAARGNDGRRFPWGDAIPTKYHANVHRYFKSKYTPVGYFSPTGDSPYGVSDMVGGFEWVDDWFGDYFFPDNYSKLPIRNPTGPEWGRDHPVRGVGIQHDFLGTSTDLQPVTLRYQWVFEFEHGHLFAHDSTGFRCAWSSPKSDRESF